jgi:protein O-mannosyl-transferase
MAKKNNKTSSQPAAISKSKPGSVSVPAPVQTLRFPAWAYDFNVQALIMGVLAFVLYCNTFPNEYARDDVMVIVQNDYVNEGFAGIPDILTTDAYQSYFRRLNSNMLSGGRYRPLSIVSFAIEQQFFGLPSKGKNDNSPEWQKLQQKKLMHDMHLRHIFNVLWFTLTVIVLLYFLRYIVFKNNPLTAFFAAVLFVIHPIHTEVVANVKSRDEIMSLLFLCLTFIFAFKYQEQKNKWFMIAGLVSYFLAFLSKEYAIGLVVLLPLAFYLFDNFSFSKSVMATLPYLGVAVIYLLIRSQIVAPVSDEANTSLLNNPYVLASGSEKLATEIATTLNYLKLLVFPKDLSSDYSYNSIPYKDFTNLLVWLSIAVHAALIWGFFYFLKRRNVLSFAIAFYLVNLLLVCNIFVDLGATMGERLVFHASVGFCIAAACLLYKGAEKLKSAALGSMSLAGCLLVLICICGFKTISRNPDWKNDKTLFFQDIKVSTNSVVVNTNVANALIHNADTIKDDNKKSADLYRAIGLLNRAVSMDTTDVDPYLNKWLAFSKLQMPDSEISNCNIIMKIYPRYPQLPDIYYNTGVHYYFNKQYPQAISAIQHAIQLRPDYVLAQNVLKEVSTAMRQQK